MAKEKKKARKPRKRVVSGSPENFLVNMMDIAIDSANAMSFEGVIDTVFSSKPASDPKEQLDRLYKAMDDNNDVGKAQKIAGSILKYKKNADNERYKENPDAAPSLATLSADPLEVSLAGYVKSVREQNDALKKDSISGVKRTFTPVFMAHEERRAQKAKAQKNMQANSFFGLIPAKDLVPKMPSFHDSKKKNDEEY